MIALIFWGWRGRQKRQAETIGELPEVPADLGATLIEPSTGLYVGSTIAPSNSTNPWVHYEFALANDQLNCRVFDAAGQQLEQLVIGTNIARFDVRLFTSNASGTQTQTNQSLAQTALAEGAQLQLIIKSERPVRAQVSDKTYSANGFADFQVSDQHLYHQISHYFIAQNR